MPCSALDKPPASGSDFPEGFSPLPVWPPSPPAVGWLLREQAALPLTTASILPSLRARAVSYPVMHSQRPAPSLAQSRGSENVWGTTGLGVEFLFDSSI